ncbi:MAG: radical SAM/SPASM domain-containing protein [Bacteroidales bacterium]|jgi:radical SAM protein with 4Fe4S-binding SPASM domain|nr:radical SAM/SPASM domain-containing protein [Bacteroidales bacterium]
MAGIFVKPANAVRSAYSYIASSLTGHPVTYGMPATVSLELTSHCNLRCPECASGSGMMLREKGFMDPALYEKVIRELNPFIWYASLYFQGEPFLHPGIFSFLQLMENTKVIISTNGHYLGGENAARTVLSGIHKLIVSLDGMDQQSYSKYRVNGNLETVMAGIRNVSLERQRLNSPMKLELQFLVNRFNEHQIAQAESFAREVKATLRLKSMQVIDGHDAGEWMPSDRKFARYESSGGRFTIKNPMPSRCLRLWLNPVITWDGKVLPCCFDKDAEYEMGDLRSQTFREIWHGRKFREFRLKLLSDRKSIPICRNCTSGMRNVKF